MRIKEIEAVHVRIPLDTAYLISRGVMNYFDSVIVRVQTESGLVGYGESVPRSVVGDASTIARLINKKIAKDIVGIDVFNIEAIVESILKVTGGNVDCVAGIDLAIWDILGKHLGQPVYRLIGGVCQDTILVDYTIGASEPSSMADTALEVTSEGFHGVVVKVPCKSVLEDVERVQAVRRVIPLNSTVRVDCNGGYSREDALSFLNKIKGLNIEFVEQPVAPDDLPGMKLCRSVGIPISADESLVTLKDALSLVSQEACDVMNIKIPKVGGILLAKRIAAIASASGLPVVVGGRPTLGISRWASRHFAISTPATLGRAHEGPGPASQALSDDVVSQRITRKTVKESDGYLKLPTSVGLSVDVLWDKVKLYNITS